MYHNLLNKIPYSIKINFRGSKKMDMHKLSKLKNYMKFFDKKTVLKFNKNLFKNLLNM